MGMIFFGGYETDSVSYPPKRGYETGGLKQGMKQGYETGYETGVRNAKNEGYETGGMKQGV